MSGHQPAVYATGRHGCWAHCECGWQSTGRASTPWGASIEWAQHILDRTRRRQPHLPDEEQP